MMPGSAAAGLRVLVTRPQDQAAPWVEGLRARGLDAAALPLIAIEPMPGAGVHAAWESLAGRSLLVFVSPAAVEQFFAHRPRDAIWPARLLAAAPGPGSAAALRAAGVPVQSVIEPRGDQAQFDSESLWDALAMARSWRNASVLIVRGGDAEHGANDEQVAARGNGRQWLAERLHEAGAVVDFMAAYRRGMPRFGAADWRLWRQALAAPRGQLWLLGSSQALVHLQQLLTMHGQGRAIDSAWRALATHPRIAQAAQAAGFGQVSQARPDLDAVAAAAGEAATCDR